MTMKGRAVLFDLDDTLYRERRYALSAFRHVACLLASTSGIDARRAFGILASSLRRGKRSTGLQALCVSVGHTLDSVPALVEVMRGHLPAIDLPSSSLQALRELRAGWRLGIVTNGFPGVQRRKVAALGAAPLVDAVVYAYEHGSGLGKPDPEPFLVAAARLTVAPERCVFVGDDINRDIAGARAVGMRTIRIVHGAASSRGSAGDLDADAVTSSIADVPRLAAALLREKSSRCA